MLLGGRRGQLSCENFVLNTNPQIKEVLIFLHFPVVVVWLRSQFFVHQACYFVSFKPRKASQFKKDVFSSCRERGTKKKFWVPMRKWVNLCLIRKNCLLIIFWLLSFRARSYNAVSRLLLLCWETFAKPWTRNQIRQRLGSMWAFLLHERQLCQC